MSKIFSECDWESDLPSIGTCFKFSKKHGSLKLKNKKPEGGQGKGDNSGQHQNAENVGWSVLLPKKTDKHTTKGKTIENNKLTNGKSDSPNSKKRKISENGNGNGVSTDNSGKSMKKAKFNDRESSNGTQQSKKSPAKRENATLNPTKQKDTAKKRGTVEQEGNFRDRLKERLKGSRFRFINEQLYKTTGEEAKKLFQEDPESFVAYHEGYRHQVVQWSMNPLDRIIKNIMKLPRDTVVADFGCGEARLAESIPNQTYSLDLVAHNSSVIACDMANTPLESNFVNVVVFCLSLMGTNLVDFLLEANRVLKVGGVLKIAEVSSRFDNVNEFVTNVEKCGFKLINKDLKHKLFYFFNFKKARIVIKGSMKIKPFSLKPCLYKKR